MGQIIIAIDGPAASGKGTLARKIAEAYGYGYLDTGLLYRAVGHEVLRAGANPDNKDSALQAAHHIIENISAAPLDNILHNVALREDGVGSAASRVAAIAEVRQALLEFQRNFPESQEKGAVLDGRDIGTVIFPAAPVKLFITASTEVRAERRLKELQSRNISATYDAVLKDMRERDARDTGRKAAPLKAADDAVILETSAMTAEEVLRKALEIVRDKLRQHKLQ